jgi:hypothetical protein
MSSRLTAGGPVNGCTGGQLYFRQRDLLTLATMRAMF